MTRDGPREDPLCNFTARVVEEVEQDDGCETSRVFKIEGQLENGQPLPTARVPADRFAGMHWVTKSWGLKAVVTAGFTTRDRLREAIQRFSQSLELIGE